MNPAELHLERLASCPTPWGHRFRPGIGPRWSAAPQVSSTLDRLSLLRQFRLRYDRVHPVKGKWPVASGEVSLLETIGIERSNSSIFN